MLSHSLALDFNYPATPTKVNLNDDDAASSPLAGPIPADTSSMDLPPADSSSITPAASSTPRPTPALPTAPTAASHPPPQHPAPQDPDPETHSSPKPASESLLQTDQDEQEPYPRPPLAPLFTLIHDPATNTTIHPRNTHYLFSDDDAGAVLSTLCARAASNISLHPSMSHPQSPSSENPNPAATEGVEERILIIDMDDSGTSVQHASSLSPNWQVLRAGIEGAPALRGERERDGGDGGMMLKIEGVGVGSAPPGKRGKRRGKGDDEEGQDGYEDGRQGDGEGIDIESEAMRTLISDFERRMEVLRNVVAGTGRGLVVGEVVDEKIEGDGEEEKEKEKGGG